MHLLALKNSIQRLDKELPDTYDLTEEEIIAEIKAVRYGQKETP